MEPQSPQQAHRHAGGGGVPWPRTLGSQAPSPEQMGGELKKEEGMGEAGGRGLGSRCWRWGALSAAGPSTSGFSSRDAEEG